MKRAFVFRTDKARLKHRAGNTPISEFIRSAIAKWDFKPRTSPDGAQPDFVSVRLTPEEAAKARRIGDGSLSLGIHRAIHG